MTIIDGDLLEYAKINQFDVIVHGANCFCTMGAGIAKQIKEQFPEAYDADCRTTKGDILKLGSYTYRKARNYDFIIINGYTQFHYGKNHIDGVENPVDYEAITLVMRKINYNFKGRRIGMPKIGAGLAGGDWNIISKIIERELKDCKVVVVNYNKPGKW
jgi:O-acetyl-ADP-ribose deacetylase (regulator of RNase III)